MYMLLLHDTYSFVIKMIKGLEINVGIKCIPKQNIRGFTTFLQYNIFILFFE